MLPLVLAAVFVIVAVVSYRSLSESSMFGKVSSAVLGCCVAGLSVIGLMQCGLWIPLEGEQRKIVVVPILIPYVALAVAIIGALFAAFLMKLMGGRSTRAIRDLGHRIVRRLQIRSEGQHRDGVDLRQLKE